MRPAIDDPESRALCGAETVHDLLAELIASLHALYTTPPDDKRDQ